MKKSTPVAAPKWTRDKNDSPITVYDLHHARLDGGRHEDDVVAEARAAVKQGKCASSPQAILDYAWDVITRRDYENRRSS